jgi:sugar porter (SP) family MFS transporter
MKNAKVIIMMIALIVALGGLLMGFDASVISGAVKFIEVDFQLTKLELGWSVASLTLSSTAAMLFAGPISDKYGRRAVLRVAAVLYAISAIGSAFAPSFLLLVIARMIGGLGVGASLILAPMYIAEIAPPDMRGRLVSFNQLNIVIGISLAFFTNYLILQWSKSDTAWALNMAFANNEWRWMLGIETLPAIIYFFGLFFVPRSPRWLLMKGKRKEAVQTLMRYTDQDRAAAEIDKMVLAMNMGEQKEGTVSDLWKPALRLVLVIGVVVAVLQQITGINSVFFYAPMIFEQSGIGTDASFVQAILVGLVNIVFTILALVLIDKLGRKPLLNFGMAGITICMGLLAYGFYTASYELKADTITALPENIDQKLLANYVGQTYGSDLAFMAAMDEAIGPKLATLHKSELITASISMNPTLILFAILGFVASFAISIGPVMWVLFSELFPNAIRGIAISFVGLINSAVSFLVQLVFPWELDYLGSGTTFLLYGIFALIGLVFIYKVVPETKGKSLEELEEQLVKY